MIADLTENLKSLDSQAEKAKAVISGKRDLMQLLVEKTLEYHRAVDPQAEIVLTDLATQYEALIDTAMSLGEHSPAPEAGSGAGAAAAGVEPKPPSSDSDEGT